MAVTITNDAATTRTNLGLGDAATKTVGTASGNIPVLDSSGQIADAQIAALSVSKLSGVGTSGQVLTSTGTTTAPTMQDAAGGGISLSGSTSGEGGYFSSGSANIFATLTIDLSDSEGKRLVVYGSSAIAETANTGGASLLSLYLVVGSTQVILNSVRQGDSMYGAWTDDSIAFMASSTVYEIPASMAGSATLTLRGGINSGSFRYGKQVSYTYYDGQEAGYTLNYFVA